MPSATYRGTVRPAMMSASSGCADISKMRFTAMLTTQKIARWVAGGDRGRVRRRMGCGAYGLCFSGSLADLGKDTEESLAYRSADREDLTGRATIRMDHALSRWRESLHIARRRRTRLAVAAHLSTRERRGEPEYGASDFRSLVGGHSDTVSGAPERDRPQVGRNQMKRARERHAVLMKRSRFTSGGGAASADPRVLFSKPT